MIIRLTSLFNYLLPFVADVRTTNTAFTRLANVFITVKHKPLNGQTGVLTLVVYNRSYKATII